MQDTNTSLSIGDAGSMLMGAGLTQLADIKIALTLIGVGVFLKVGVALLQKQGVDIKSPPPNMG